VYQCRSRRCRRSARVQDLVARFRRRIEAFDAETAPLDAYALAAVRLDDSSDIVAARYWVGVLAEAALLLLIKEMRRKHDGVA
jgi:hypothetical protein